VAVGDPITFADDFEMLDKNIGVARAFDNRIGTWAVVEALRLAAGQKASPKCAIYACSSIQEETGLNGAQMQVFNVKPDIAVAVDVTHATETPGINVKQHGEVKMGDGPTVSVGRENHPLLVERLRSAARKAKVKLQTETFSITGGTDAYAYWTKHGDIPSAIVGIPNRYMHSTVEMLDLRDAENTAKLLAALCADLKKGERLKVKV
jgi:endoglucanase